jgi:hypothetical protein
VRPADIGDVCPVYAAYGACRFGIACRFGSHHYDFDKMEDRSGTPVTVLHWQLRQTSRISSNSAFTPVVLALILHLTMAY